MWYQGNQGLRASAQGVSQKARVGQNSKELSPEPVNARDKSLSTYWCENGVIRF